MILILKAAYKILNNTTTTILCPVILMEADVLVVITIYEISEVFAYNTSTTSLSIKMSII